MTVSPEDILRGHSREVSEIAEALRSLIHETLGDMTEKAYPGWQGIGFRHPRSGYVCGIFPRETSARLLFERGVLLTDPNGLLEGDGKQTRHLDISSVDEIPREAIRLFLYEAVSL
ncbi:MAG: DUF1801 domain-containing protein [Anaerolineales bacterium]|nr:DUF1801 domain-containing protein [Anaerolineales bacterium]